MGYIVQEALDAVHDALDNKLIIDTSIEWDKVLSALVKIWYAGVRITKQGKWLKEAVSCASTLFS